jgi:two-component system response regulator LytT
LNILILEDEAPAANRLVGMLKRLRPEATILAQLEGVTEARDWLAVNPPPDLAFFDIRLADGTCFDVFEICDVPCPVIFCTAHDEFALQAFRTSGIDYLLKPVSEPDLVRALAKFDSLRGVESDQRQTVRRIAQGEGYKTRLVVNAGTRLKPVATADAIAFLARDKGVMVHLGEGRSYFVDYTLAELDEALDPADFYRISRSAIIAAKSVETAQNEAGRWSVSLTAFDAPLSISRQRVSGFHKWLAN